MKRGMTTGIGRLCATGIAVLFASTARADPPTPTGEGAFESHVEHHTDDETRLRAQAGGSFASGNTQAVSINTSGTFALRRGLNQFQVDGALNYGVGWVPPVGMTTGPRTQVTTAENYLGRARYDRFFLGDNSVFVVAQGYRDVPSGFNSRISGQIGYLRNIFNVPQRRRLWAEVGYDLTYENIVLPVPLPPPPLPPTERVLHSARVFVGYEDHSTPLFDVTLGVEGIIPLYEQSSTMNGAALDLWRLNGVAQIGSRISDSFQIALSFVCHYLNTPVTGHDPFDTLTIVTLVYQRVSHPPPPTVTEIQASSSPPPAESSAPPSAAPSSEPPASAAPASASPEPATAPTAAP